MAYMYLQVFMNGDFNLRVIKIQIYAEELMSKSNNLEYGISNVVEFSKGNIESSFNNEKRRCV